MSSSIHAVFIAAVALFGLAATGQPTGCVSAIGHLDVNTALNQGEAPVVRNGFMYHVISTNPSGTEYELIAVDISDPASPTVIGSVGVPNPLSCGMLVAIALRGPELYVLSSSGLSLYDITAPASPVRVRTLSTVALPCGGVSPGIAVHDQSVVVLSGQVYVIDRALMRVPPPPPPGTPNNPIVAVLSLGGQPLVDLEIFGDTAVVTTSSEAHAIDISSPSGSFVRESTSAAAFPAQAAFDEAGRLFIAGLYDSYAFESVDPFSPATPLTEVTTWPTLGLAASGPLLAAGSVDSGARIYRVSDLSLPVQIGASSPVFCEGVRFHEGLLIVVSRDDGIFIQDVSACMSAGCPADYNGDTFPDVLDFLDFFDDFGACDQQPAPCGSLGNPDFNGDNVIDVVDFLDFLDAFGQGC